MSRRCREGLHSEHPWKVRQRIFYLPIGEEEPLLWKCSVERMVKILLTIGYLLWCEQQSGMDGPNLNY